MMKTMKMNDDDDEVDEPINPNLPLQNMWFKFKIS